MSRTVAEIEALFPSLQTYKTNIRNAIIAQGVDVPSNATVSDYATYILQIVHVIPDSVTITSSTSLTPTYSSTTYTITFTTEGTSDWSITSNQSWCTFNTSSGSTTGNHSVTLTVAENNSTTNRSATITITCGTASGTIAVNQAMNTSDITVNYIGNGNLSSTARGTQYLQLPITFKTIIKNNYKIVTKIGYANTSYNSSYIMKPFFGTARNDTEYGYNLGMRQSSSTDNRISYYSTDIFEDTIDNPWGSSYSTTEFTIQKNQCNFIRPQTTSSKATLGNTNSYGTVYGNDSVRLFYGRGVYAMKGVRIYYFKIYNSSGTLLYNYVPVRHYYNGSYVVCMKETVNNTYVYNSGTGNFTYG